MNKVIIGDATLYCGDSIKILPELGECADLLVSDPPYKLTVGGGQSGAMQGCFDKSKYENDGQIVICDITWQKISKLCFDVLKPNNHAYIMTNNRNMEEALCEIRKSGFKLHNILVWDKGTVTPNRYYMNGVEFGIFVYKNKSKYIKDMGLSNLHKVHNEKGNGHPTEKPIELMKLWIEQSSNIGDLVVDPFMGVGSTAIAALKSGRKFIGIELEQKWFDLAVKRITDYYEQPQQNSLL